MERLAPVIELLQKEKVLLEQELDKINRLLEVAEATDKKATPKSESSRWNSKRERGSEPKDEPRSRSENQTKNKKKYAPKRQIVDDLHERLVAHKKEGKSFVESFPGSVSLKQLSEESGISTGTVSRAAKQLILEGKVEKRNLSWKELGSTQPHGQISVFAATEGGGITNDTAVPA